MNNGSMNNTVSLYAVQSQEVVCRASTNCNGAPGDVLGVMTIEKCCMNDTINSLGFSEGNICSPCIGECITVWHTFMKDKVASYDGLPLYINNSLWIHPRLIYWSGAGTKLHSSGWLPERCCIC